MYTAQLKRLVEGELELEGITPEEFAAACMAFVGDVDLFKALGRRRYVTRTFFCPNGTPNFLGRVKAILVEAGDVPEYEDELW